MAEGGIPTADSSLLEVKAIYDDNAAYAELESPTMARRFITACTILLQRTPQFSEHGLGSERMSFDLERLREQQQDARAWLLGEGQQFLTSGHKAMRHADLRYFRG